MIKNMILLILGVNLLTPTFSQDTIPFRLNSDKNIIVQGLVNNSDSLDLMLHSASNVFTIIKSAVSRLQSIHFENKDSIDSWGGTGETRYSENNLLKLRNTSYDSLRVWENEYSGKDTDGKIGFNLFDGEIIELDFEKKIIVLRQKLIPLPGDYKPFRIIFQDDFIFIEGALFINNNQIKHQFMVHSGYAGSVLLDDEFTEVNNLLESIEVTNQQDLKDSYGNVLKTYQGKINRFTLGSIQIENCPVSFFTGSIKRQKMSIIGTDIISRFNWIFDLKNELVYLKIIS